MKKLLEFLREIDPLVHLAFLVAIVVLSYGYLSLSGRLDTLGTSFADIKRSIASVQILPTKPDETPIATTVSSATPTATAKPKTTTTVTAPAKKNVTYINLGGTFGTVSTDWTDVPGSDTYIDLKNEYNENAYVDWEASTHIDSSSGTVTARLYDVTHSIGVIGSDLAGAAVSSTRHSSGRLYLWAGHNLYRVQIKSTDPYTATFDNGRIKVTY